MYPVPRQRFAFAVALLVTGVVGAAFVPSLAGASLAAKHQDRLSPSIVETQVSTTDQPSLEARRGSKADFGMFGDERVEVPSAVARTRTIERRVEDGTSVLIRVPVPADLARR